MFNNGVLRQSDVPGSLCTWLEWVLNMGSDYNPHPTLSCRPWLATSRLVLDSSCDVKMLVQVLDGPDAHIYVSCNKRKRN